MSPSIQHEPTCRSQVQAQSQPRSQSEAPTQPQTQTQPADEGRRANGCGESSDAVTEDDSGPAAAAAAEQQFYDYGCSPARLACACACAVYEVTVVPVLRAAHLPRKARKGTLRGIEYMSKA